MRPSYNDSLFYSRVCAHDVPLTCKKTPVKSTHQTDQTAHCYCSCKTSWCLCFLFRYLQNLSSTRKPFNVSLFYECKMCLTCRVSGEGWEFHQSCCLFSLSVFVFICLFILIYFITKRQPVPFAGPPLCHLGAAFGDYFPNWD